MKHKKGSGVEGIPHEACLLGKTRTRTRETPHASPISFPSVILVRRMPSMDSGPARFRQVHATTRVPACPRSMEARARGLAGVLDTHHTVGGRNRGSHRGTSLGRCIGGMLVAVRRPYCSSGASVPRPPLVFHLTVAGRLVARDNAWSALADLGSDTSTLGPRRDRTTWPPMGRSVATRMLACSDRRERVRRRLEDHSTRSSNMAGRKEEVCIFPLAPTLRTFGPSLVLL